MKGIKTTAVISNEGPSDFLEDRKADWAQLKYLAKHKKDVYQSGRQLDVPRLQAIKHDYTKFKPSNWTAYRDYWFGPQSVRALGSRDKVPIPIKLRFDEAAKDHKNSEKHHMHLNTTEPVTLKNVPQRYRKEMLADWHSLAKRTSVAPKDFPDVKTWAQQKDLDWMHKLSSYLAHVTNRDNVDGILESGKLKRIKDFKKDEAVSVEPYKGLTLRTTKPVDENHKSKDHIFFTRNGYDGRYGNYVILTKHKKFIPHDKFTFIPNEVKSSIPVLLRNKNTMIFAPNSDVDRLAKKYPDYSIRSLDSLPIPKFTITDRLNKLLEKKANKLPVSDGIITGSSRLGINLPEKSDTDILVKVKDYDEAIGRSIKLLRKFPQFKASPYNDPKNKKRIVFTGLVNGKETDIVYNWSDEAEQIIGAFDKAEEYLNQNGHVRNEIIETKKRLKDAWLFPETRYKKYKTKINKDLGVYF